MALPFDCRLVEDTAWHPVRREEMSKWNPSKFPFFLHMVDSRSYFRRRWYFFVAMAWLYKTFLGSPLKLWASIGHWAIWHFDLSKYAEQQKPRVIVSLVAVFAFMAVGWPLIVHFTGWTGFVKFWLMPWLGYHFWMSEYTFVASHVCRLFGLFCQQRL